MSQLIRCLVAFAAASIACVASAEVRTRAGYGGPVGLCQAALPAYEGAIRKRPLAIQNEGSAPAYVTCGFTSQGDFGFSPTNPISVAIFMGNAGAVAATIQCTAVAGFDGAATVRYSSKTRLINAGGYGALSWAGPDFVEGEAMLPSGAIAVSCLLPPGTKLNDNRMLFNEDIGT